MTPFGSLTPDVRVSGQITVEDIRRAAADGVARIVNNRPDKEEAFQPLSSELQAAAELANVEYIHVPIVGIPDHCAVRAVEQALGRGGTTWIFCRSGLRSTAAWALAMSRSGALEPDTIRAIAARANYDLSQLPL